MERSQEDTRTITEADHLSVKDAGRANYQPRAMLSAAFQILLVTTGETWDKPQVEALCWRADTEALGKPVELLPPPFTHRTARVESDSPVGPPALPTSQGKPEAYRAPGEAFINMPWEPQKERQESEMEAALEETVAGRVTSVTMELHSIQAVLRTLGRNHQMWAHVPAASGTH